MAEGHKHKLYLKVLDKDLVGTDTIGDTKFDFEESFNGAPIDTW
jgi:hypothetical protein